MKPLSGKMAQAKELLDMISMRAMETGKRVFDVRFMTKETAKSMRNGCYNYMKRWARDIEEQAILDNLDPLRTANKAVLEASWASVSIQYSYSNPYHILTFHFQRIATDPSWKEQLQSMIHEPPEPMSGQEIYDLTQETNSGKGTKD